MALENCPECSGTVSSTARTCPHCGAALNFCKSCGRALPLGAETCPWCGTPADVVVEEWLPSRRLSKPKKGDVSLRAKLWIGLVAAVLLFLVFTCPRKARHEQELQDRISLAVQELRDSVGVDGGLGALTQLVADQVTKSLMSRQFSVDNYLVCSVGKVHFNQHTVVISFGAVHHVWCFISKDDIKAEIQRFKARKKDQIDDLLETVKSIFR